MEAIARGSLKESSRDLGVAYSESGVATRMESYRSLVQVECPVLGGRSQYLLSEFQLSVCTPM